MMYGYYGAWGGHSIFGGVISIILLILLIVFVVRLLLHRGSSHFHHGHHGYFRENSAIDILKERYAKGEINKEEFEMKMKDLSS